MKTWIAGEVLSASDLNSEFSNILSNPGSLICPIGFNLTFTDATYDIGASGATRPRDFYLSRNAVIGGTLTELKRASIYHYTAWDPSDVAGSNTNAPATAAATSAAASYITAANSSGTVTFTNVLPGLYRFTIRMMNECAANVATYINMNAVIGGTATFLMGTPTISDVFFGPTIANGPVTGTDVFYATMTAAQTVTILPRVAASSAGVTTNYTTQCTISAEYVGAS